MKLTKKKAIELSIELWTWLAETGENKNEWPEWKRHGGQYEECEHDCFLCKYDDCNCGKCPYPKHYKVLCDDDGTPFSRWFDSRTKQGRKKYAKQFLEQLKELLK